MGVEETKREGRRNGKGGTWRGQGKKWERENMERLELRVESGTFNTREEARENSGGEKKSHTSSSVHKF